MAEADRRAWLEREPRWARVAGLIALLGVALFIASVVIQQVGAGDVDTDAERLLEHEEDSGRLLTAEVIGGIGFALFAAPLYVLFRAAEARAERVRRALVAFAFIGPMLLGIAGVVSTIGLSDAADQFVEEDAAPEQIALNEFLVRVDRDPEAIDRITIYSGEDGLDVEPREGAPYSVAYPADRESSLQTRFEEEEGIDVDVDEDGIPGDALAEDLIEDSGTIQVGTSLLFPGLLGLVIGLVYIPLWAMRTGLMTRFWATLGMALGVSLILLPFAQLAVVLWFVALSLLLVDLWPGGRPAAWEAGVAVPWPRPGEEAADTARDTAEGRGRELEESGLPSDEEQPPETPSQAAPREPPPPSGPPPRKRKRRR